MATADKSAAVAEITEAFRSSSAAMLTEYRGLTVKQITELRRALRADGTYAVVKNTLTKLAAKNAGIEGIDDLLVGPSAIAFVTGDAVNVAKALRDFSKANPALVVKGGYMDGKAMNADEIKQLADLESRDVLLAKLAGAMKASLTKAAVLFQAPLSKAVRTVVALEPKLEAGSPAPAEATDATEASEAAAPEATEAPAE